VKKLDTLRAHGIEPFGGAFETSGSIAEILRKFREGEILRAAGRITAKRDMGKSHFLDLRDITETHPSIFSREEMSSNAIKIFHTRGCWRFHRRGGSLFF
jgi:lysyl-tRNA synthetase class 2